MNNLKLSSRITEQPPVSLTFLTDNLEMCCPRGCGEPRRPRGDLAPEHPAGVRGRVVEDDVGRRRVSQDLQKKVKSVFFQFVSPPGLA